MNLTRPRGFSEEFDVIPEVQQLADHIKQEVEAKFGTTYKTFHVEKFSQQVVSGTNYRLKIRVGDGEQDYINVGVFKALPHQGGGLLLTDCAGPSVVQQAAF